MGMEEWFGIISLYGLGIGGTLWASQKFLEYNWAGLWAQVLFKFYFLIVIGEHK